MRINQPVSQCERVVDDGAFLVSKTDLKGRIVYANAAFVAISGFTEDELIGSAHNMVRHPDMPPAAFDDMWRALKAGRQWQGVVKNRCKNGDYYWVWANANPIWEDGHVVGFMSLRTRASREQIEQADAFFRTLREGRRGWTVRDGKPARTGPLGLAARLLHGAAARQVELMLGLLLAALAAHLAFDFAYITPRAWSAIDLLLALALAASVGRGLLRPLREFERRLLEFGAGRLVLDFAPMLAGASGSLRHALNTAIGNLAASTVTDLQQASQRVQSAADEVSATASSLSQSTSEQASAVEQTSSSLELTAGSVGRSAGHAQRTSSAAGQAARRASEGDSAVGATVRAMHDIAQRVALVDDIAYRTNMLALNAAIEAARAGASGRSFAVVAAEVGKLAESARATSAEIGQLAGDALSQATSTRDLFKTMLAEIEHASGLVDEMARACGEQSSGLDQISHAVAQVSSTTQHNASASEQLASTAASLSTQAGQLRGTLAQLRLEQRRELAAGAPA
ncbi:aerotaxis receptor [mine drainage metagenome]|uniref:Aerotaxis receptor n=1 Tax=mine drainage metagenome TaxID=410659 RepID=A0A1J5QSU1_9ZZZZ